MIKELAIRFFTAFHKPSHMEEDPIPIEQEAKGWKIKLSSQSLMEKVEEAENIKPIVMQESAEHLKRNTEILKSNPWPPWDECYWSHIESHEIHSDKKWRIKE